MSPQNVSPNSPQDEPIGFPMNDATNETRPYPEHDPMNDLLSGRTTPPEASTSAPAAHNTATHDTASHDTAATDVIEGIDRPSGQAQDATTTESFAWTAATIPREGAARAANEAPPRVAGSDPASAPVVADRQPTPPRAGTIVWGCILFLVAALAAVPAVIGETVLSPTTILWIVVGFGALLVLGGIVGAIVGVTTRASRSRATHDQ
jgi:hypothetical protein